ncbi:MAG: CHAD domain-containing protein [Gammaproteobacteria bacterium]|nr:CHAD domain-containing protein [Gammaproteobacteria bacterium]
MTKKKAIVVDLTPNQSVSEMIELLFMANFEYMLTWRDQARSWQQPLGVHQFRVSFRRMRSLFTLFRTVIPRPLARDWTTAMRALASEAGEARDLDVFLTETVPAVEVRRELPALSQLIAKGSLAREEAYQRVVLMLDSSEFATFCERFPSWLRQRLWEQGGGKIQKKLKLPAGEYAQKLLIKQISKINAMGSDIDTHNAEAMHQLRIEFKKLRYALDSFQPLFTNLSTFTQHSKGMQELLGNLNDIEVMNHLLHRLLEGENDSELHYAAGVVSGWHEHKAYHTLTEFNQRWQEFVTAEHDWQLESHFES